MKTKSSLFLICLGLLLNSLSLMLRQFAHVPDFVLGFITGIAIGALILGIIKGTRYPYKENAA
jgi:uncharacterized transporter YbjL